MTDTTNTTTNVHTSTDLQEPRPEPQSGRRSSLSKMVDIIKKPFRHKDNNQKEAAIDKMKVRKHGTAQKMESEGKDTNVLSGKRTDII